MRESFLRGLTTPCLVPDYCDPEEIIRKLGACIPPPPDFDDLGRTYSASLPFEEVECFLPPWATELWGTKSSTGSFFNCYSSEFDLSFHPDRCGSYIRCVLGVKGSGALHFRKVNQAEDLNDEAWELPIDPGDAIFWNDNCEDAGWLHGGKTGGRTSLVLRFQ